MLNWASSVWKSGSADQLQDLLVDHRRVAGRVGEVELDLEAHAAPLGVEPGLGQHPGEHVQAALHLLPVPLTVLAGELPARDVLTHVPPLPRARPRPTLARERRQGEGPSTGASPGSVQPSPYRPRHAPAPHLRLAPGPVVPPGGPAPGAGARARPPGRDGPLGAGRRWWSCPATSTTGRCPRSTTVALLDDALGRLAAHRGADRPDQRQPRLGPPARLRVPVDRRRRRPPAHRRSSGRHEPVLLEDEHGAGRGLRHPLPRARRRARRPARRATSRSHAAVLTAAMGRIRADLADPAGHPVGGAGARVRGRRAGQRQRARHHAWAASRRSRCRRSTASTTPRWVTCTAPSGWPTTSATAGPRSRYSFSEEHQPSRCCSSSWATGPAGRRGHRRGLPTPVHRPLARLHRSPRRPADGRPLVGVRESLPAGHPHRRRPSPRADGAAASPLPARPRARLRARTASTPTPSRATRPGCAAAPTFEVTTDFVEHVRGPAEPAEEALLRAALEGVRVDEAAR